MGSLRILLLVAVLVNNVSTHPSTIDYLDEKLRQTKIEIAKLYFQEEPPVPRKLYKAKWDELWQQSFSKKRPFIENAFSGALLVDGDRIVPLSVNAPSLNKSSSQEISWSPNNAPIKFIRSIVWKTVFYLVICYETCTCRLYTGTDNFQLKPRQTMQHKGCPTDASFFVRTNRLYLVVADNSGKITVPSMIYHWRGTYMDVVAEAMTTAAVSVATFKHKQSTIIVFAQNDRSVPGIGSVVYEFKETSADKIQFLSTLSPVSVYHYDHAGFNFIFLMNQRGPSSLFWWDGQELLSWQQVPEIEATSLVHTLNINDTFFFVGHKDVLRLYKFENASDCSLVGSMKLPNGETVVDVCTRIDESAVIVVLVTINENDVYGASSWELQIEELSSEDSTEETDVLSKHLSELVEMLQQRKPLVEKAEASWPSLLPANENLTVLEPLTLPSLVLESGNVGNIDVFVDGDFITPKELQQTFESLSREVNETLAKSKKLLTSNNVNSLMRNAAKLQNNTIGSDEDVGVQNLEINSLCGIPFQYWALKNDTMNSGINFEPSDIEFSKDAVHLRSNLSVTNFNAKTLNDVNVDEFLSELFIINQNQKIKGDVTFKKLIRIDNLTVQLLNDLPWENHMNTKTNQSFDRFFVKTLRVENLYADSINGVNVSEAARVSRENVIKGKVKLAHLHVTEKLTTDPKALKLPEENTLQIYYNVTINGNLRVKVLNLNKHTKIFLNDTEVNLNNISNDFWTKSTDQVIKNNITFESNLIIDQLNATFLNGLSEDEYLYTTATTIPENFKNLHFENVHVDDAFFTGEEEQDALFDIAPESLTIRDTMHLKSLRGNKLLVQVFNNLLVTDILSGKANFSENVDFPSIQSKTVNVDDLNFLFINKQDSVSFFENDISDPEDRKAEFVKMPEVHVENLVVERINDLEMAKLESLKHLEVSDLQDLVIDADLTVKDNLYIEKIDDQDPEDYLRNMLKEDIIIDSKEVIDELVVQNATLKFLHGHDVDRLFDNFLSKTKKQTIPGYFSFYKITTDNIESRYINKQDTSKLKWIDGPISFSGNITFDDLIVEGDIVTQTLNDYNVNELYKNLLNVPATKITDLRVNGNISWNLPSNSTASLTHLFENAMTKTTDQVINGDTVFENDVSMSTLEVQFKEIDEIRDIMNDMVIDDGEDVEVAGEKIFKDNLSVDALSVTGDVGVVTINNIDVLQFNDSVARKDQVERITGPITFLHDVTIYQLLADDSVHDVPLKGLVLATDRLPSNVSFKHLIVQKDVYLKNLDGIEFDRFMEDRVTIDGDHEIVSDVQFDDTVGVTGNATVTTINGIDPSDLVLDGTAETQVISGTKTFVDDVVVNGNAYAPLINGVDIVSEYSSGVQNDEDVEIIGDLIFESEAKLPENVSVSGLVNEINLHTILDDLEEQSQKTFQTLKRREIEIEDSVNQSTIISKSLKNIFSYLEMDDQLKIQAPNIKNIDVVYYEEITKLNMFGEEPGPLCGLPVNCSCPTEYVAELTKDGCHIWRTNGTAVVRNYHELHSTFGVNVISSTVSSRRECISNKVEDEFTTISWMKPGMIETGDVLADVKEMSSKIRGFLKDADVFMAHDNTAFVVLAIYYDPLQATHRTDSVIFKIDFDTNKLSLHQRLETDGAWAIEIFKTNHRDIYLLIGCFGHSERSFLYRLDTDSSQFTTLRSFGGRTRNVKTLLQEEYRFIFLDDFDTNAVNVYHYDSEYDNFYDYQSLFHDSRIEGVECFYADEFGRSDSFIIVTTENDQFYIYEYMFAQKFRLKVHHRMDDLQAMVPFYYSGNRYIFTGSSTNSTVLRIVQQGPH